MTRRDPAVALRQMRDFAAETVDLAAGRTRAGLDSDCTLFLALTRLVELVGEASTRVDDDSRARLSGVPWRAIKETRNRLIHAYDDIDPDVLWQIVTVDPPELIRMLDGAWAPIERSTFGVA
ncbi:MAG: DUF86 domain-containing protein [Phycisphaerales bacterium]